MWVVAVLVGNMHGRRNSVIIAENSIPNIARLIDTAVGVQQLRAVVCRYSVQMQCAATPPQHGMRALEQSPLPIVRSRWLQMLGWPQAQILLKSGRDI
jgi:hypothetical protein